MPKKKTPELTPEEQFKRFQETAKKLEVDGKEAEDSFKKLSAEHRNKKARKAT